MLPDCSLPVDPVPDEKVLHGARSRLPIPSHMFSLCHGVDHATRGLVEAFSAPAPDRAVRGGPRLSPVPNSWIPM